MELKLRQYHKYAASNFVLIVPYGIETIVGVGSAYVASVLIVPYGIETFLFQRKHIHDVLF